MCFKERVGLMIFQEIIPTTVPMKKAQFRKCTMLPQIKKKQNNDWKATNKSENGLSFNEQKEYNKLEKEIKNLEKSRDSLQNRFSTATLNPEEIKTLSIELSEISEQIDVKTERWFVLSDIKDS